ncbi:MAG: class I SAM-dependent methyltransferase [Desulfobacterales bacterium]
MLPNNEKQSTRNCPLCDTNQISHYWAVNHLPKKKWIYWCSHCGYGWQHPMPAPEEINVNIQNYPSTMLQNAEEKEAGFQNRLKLLQKISPHRGNILDIGSGLGHFLKLAHDQGWTVSGVEPQKSAVKACYEQFGIQCHAGFVTDLVLQPESFDVITLWDVLEHVNNPIELLKKCVSLIRPGGIFAFAIPNASGFPARIFKGNWRYVMETHLSYFTLPFIQHALSENGLEILQMIHTIKAQSILQGFTAFLPWNVEIGKVIRIGCENDIENKPLFQRRTSRKPIFKTLNTIRELVHKLNMTPIYIPLGDMVDIYCKKIS